MRRNLCVRYRGCQANCLLISAATVMSLRFVLSWHMNALICLQVIKMRVVCQCWKEVIQSSPVFETLDMTMLGWKKTLLHVKEKGRSMKRMVRVLRPDAAPITEFLAWKPNLRGVEDLSLSSVHAANESEIIQVLSACTPWRVRRLSLYGIPIQGTFADVCSPPKCACAC